MIKKIILFLRHLSILGHWRFWFFYLVAFSIVFIPAFTIRMVNYRSLRNDLTSLTLSRQAGTVVPAAETLDEELHHIEDLALSLANHPSVRSAVADGNWDAAISAVDEKVKLTNDVLISRSFLADAKGILMADRPTFPEVHGQDFSYRDWYAGVIASGKPYLSSAYARTADASNVVTLAAPVTDATNKTIGILALQIKLKDLADWYQHSISGSGLIYVVDQRGEIVYHPRYNPADDIVSATTLKPVKEALRGQSGIVLSTDPISKTDMLAAYQAIPTAGWGVVSEQSPQVVYAPLRQTLERFLTIEFIGMIWNMAVLILLLALVHRLMQYIFVEHYTSAQIETKTTASKMPTEKIQTPS